MRENGSLHWFDPERDILCGKQVVQIIQMKVSVTFVSFATQYCSFGMKYTTATLHLIVSFMQHVFGRRGGNKSWYRHLLPLPVVYRIRNKDSLILENDMTWEIVPFRRPSTFPDFAKVYHDFVLFVYGYLPQLFIRPRESQSWFIKNRGNRYDRIPRDNISDYIHLQIL